MDKFIRLHEEYEKEKQRLLLEAAAKGRDVVMEELGGSCASDAEMKDVSLLRRESAVDDEVARRAAEIRERKAEETEMRRQHIAEVLDS